MHQWEVLTFSSFRVALEALPGSRASDMVCDENVQVSTVVERSWKEFQEKSQFAVSGEVRRVMGCSRDAVLPRHFCPTSNATEPHPKGKTRPSLLL
jgi:hypothetical protein